MSKIIKEKRQKMKTKVKTKKKKQQLNPYNNNKKLKKMRS